MSKMLNVDTLIRKLEGLATKSRKDSNLSVKVGYLANYAIFVHENMTAHHPVGQAKFLERPMRENRDKYAQIVTTKIKNHRSWTEALMAGGLALQRDSQELCPVDTGALKASAFTDLVPGK